MAELVVVNEEHGHVDLVIKRNPDTSAQVAPKWPKCEDKPCYMHELFQDDADQVKLRAFLEEMAANPFVEVARSGLVIPDAAIRLAAIPESDTRNRRYYEEVGKRTSASFTAWGQMRNPCRVYSARRLEGARIGVFRGEEQIGEYQRSYSALFGSFYPFAWKGRHYALYSGNYTTTRVMTLPECQDLGGEEPDGGGFCPVDYYVPCSPLTGEMVGFGFLSGCIWGDDNSWKLEFLDLSEVDRGIIKREERFGYVELPDEMELAEAVQVRWEYARPDKGPWPWITIVQQRAYKLATGEPAYGG